MASVQTFYSYRQQSIADLAISYVHMHVNRFIRSAAGQKGGGADGGRLLAAHSYR